MESEHEIFDSFYVAQGVEDSYAVLLHYLHINNIIKLPMKQFEHICDGVIVCSIYPVGFLIQGPFHGARVSVSQADKFPG